MNTILLVIAFCLVVGIALLFCNLMQVEMMEGMALSALVIIGASFFSVFISLIHPIFIIIIISLLVYRFVPLIVGQNKHGTRLLFYMKSPSFIALCSLFVLSLIIYHGAMILNIEELSLWASADKYMYQFHRLYHYDGHIYLEGASFFHYYFLKMSGYRDATLYVANTLLYWIGLLLPCANMKKKEWPRMIMYILILYVGLYSMYLFGSKTCSPDIPYACWAGGLVGWWATRRRKKEKTWVFMGGVILLLSLGGLSKLPITIMVALFPMLKKWTSQGSHGAHDSAEGEEKPFPALPVLLIIITLTVLTALHFISAGLYPNSGKAVAVFFECLIEKTMSLGKADLNYTFLFGFALVIILFCISYEQRQMAKEIIFYIGYITYTAIIYCCSLYFGILSKENFTEAAYREGLQRAIAVYIIFILVMCFSWMICDRNHDNNRMIYAPGILILLIFVYGINNDYITDTTAAYPEKSVYYADIMKVKKEIEYLDRTFGSDKKIYMITQALKKVSDESDLYREEAASAYASYMLGSRVNNFRTTAWRYSLNGGNVYRYEDPYQTLWNLPAMLKKEQYDYVWVYKPDVYLRTYLPQIMGDETEEEKKNEEEDEKMTESYVKRKRANIDTEGLVSSKTLYGGQVYKVVKGKNKKTMLRLYDSALRYENRKEYYEWNDMD